MKPYFKKVAGAIEVFLGALLSWGAVVAFRVVGDKYRRRLAWIFLGAGDSESFITFHVRPQEGAHVSTVNDQLSVSPKIAVVIQGGLLSDNHFTIETLNAYKNIFRGHPLILSTWDGESEAVLKEAERIGVHCCVNPKPKYFGVSNINLQIVSSRAGVRAAHKLGCEYVLKTRTDQRIYAPDTGEYLYNLCETFPVAGNYPKQKKRIVGVSLNTFKYRMYGLSDMLVYGHIEDMLLYWDIDTDTRVFTREETEKSRTLASFAKWRVCEVYLATEFLKKIGRELQWTLQDSWRAYAENFCVVDREQFDLFWPKYGREEYRWRSYGQNYKTREMTFRDWFNIYRGLNNREIDERLLDQ
ncbi:MAG: hypothetical protein A2X31_07515 [Elusimicrobia bacterium GWB2_63_22]|nr:MAG: hypothetical protein A2X31_07515 [Elusimicrobia bacterium GWB2_63_22]